MIAKFFSEITLEYSKTAMTYKFGALIIVVALAVAIPIAMLAGALGTMYVPGLTELLNLLLGAVGFVIVSVILLGALLAAMGILAAVAKTLWN